MKSYAGYSKLMLIDSMEYRGSKKLSRFQTNFYLIPDSIILNIDKYSFTINKATFRLTPINLIDYSKNYLETEWAKQFNRSSTLIFEKHPELKNVHELFKLYILLNECLSKKKFTFNNSAEYEFEEIPRTLESIKLSELIEVPDLLIDKPFRTQFIWFILSGGITFDITNASVIKNTVKN